MDDLVACCVGEESSLLTWLFDRGARVNERTVRNAAVGPTSIPTMAMLIEKCGLAPLTNQGALQFAAYYGKLDMVQFLLDAGAGIDDISPEQDIREGGPYTALYEAVRGQRVDIVRFLLDRGAKVNIACRGDETALQAATRLGYREIVELIEEKKKSPRYPV
ncbi:ankyrin, partial [Wilcoxina mikolae CBS 423.85]